MTEPTSTPDGGLREAVEAVASRLLHFDVLNEQVPAFVDVPDDYEAGVNEAGRILLSALAAHREPVPTPDSEGDEAAALWEHIDDLRGHYSAKAANECTRYVRAVDVVEMLPVRNAPVPTPDSEGVWRAAANELAIVAAQDHIAFGGDGGVRIILRGLEERWIARANALRDRLAPDSAADDTGAGERECPEDDLPCSECPGYCLNTYPATPDADATPPPGDGEVEALRLAIHRGLRACRVEDGSPVALIKGSDILHVTHMVEAELSEWLKADRAARDAEVGERIARAIESDPWLVSTAKAHAARIARGVTS